VVFNPVAGDHVNVLGEMVELAVKLTLPPGQMPGAVGVTVIVGLGFTVIMT
jgi:hypothetical protein